MRVARLLSCAELAELLGISTRTVQRFVARGEWREGVHYVRFGRHVRFRSDAVIAPVRTRTARHRAVSDALLAEME